MRRLVLPLVITALATGVPVAVEARDDVRVYRCVDERGRVALRDSPCDTGQRQEVRTMLRPVDGAPPAPAPTATPGPATRAPAPQVVVVRAPVPMYRCTRPDGTDYTSDSSEGNPRWVPLWTMGYGYGPPRRPSGPRVDVGVERGGNGVTGRVDIDHRVGPRRPPHGGYAYGPAGTWIRDACRPMPQAEVCSVIGERRDVIRRRFFNAQPTERDQLRREETAINARLAQDCGR